jgi:hypothetical protein
MSSNLVPTGDDFSNKTLRSMSGRGQRALTAELDRIKGDAIVAAFEKRAEIALALMHEQGRAVLANEAMNEVAALTAFEEFIAVSSPKAGARVAAIVNAYTTGSVQAVMRW